ncbi:YrzE family protein [Microbacterium sp. B35-04]|uniref:YrzE family protein n=1 Tax=Microbacterium sp. B35-04 TaxID=1961716 RepID=UPI0013D3DB7F|nr:YrzE family protein [Microbacterium sp. B35-04]
MSDPRPPQPSGEQPSGQQPSSAQPSGQQPSAEQPSGEQPSSDGAPTGPVADGASPRPYTAPSPDAPQYAMPAYAIPSQVTPAPGEAPSAASPGTPPLAHAYATPSYADPGTAPRPGTYAYPTAYAAPSAAYAAPVAAPATGLPPYARAAAAPPPSYPGAPAFGTGGSFPPGGIDTRPKALAVVALSMAGAGVLLLLVAAVIGSAGVGWLSPLLLCVSFVLSLIALISRKQGGKGFGVGALLLSIVGGILTVVIAVAWVFGAFTSSSGGDVDEYDGYNGEDYSVPGIAAPGTDGQPDPGAQFAPPVQPTATETAFGREYDDVWWYAVVVDNPNADYVFDAYAEVHAYAEDGSMIGSAPAYTMLLSGKTALVGYFFDLGDAEIARIDADLPEASQATLSPGTETGFFTVEVDATPAGTDGTVAVTGTTSAHFADDQEFVAVTVLARAADGTIAAATSTYLDAVPGDGTPVAFEAWFEDLPADATVEAFAHR